jgi:putative membrane protein
MSRRRYLTLLAAVYVVFWAALAIEPYYRADWLLENGLVFVGIAIVVGTYRVLPLSRVSYTAIFVFMCLHTVGAHYTYAEVPYDAVFRYLTGSTLSDLMGWQRNYFDRLVHFCYGLLLAYPIREVFLRVASVRGFWGYFLPLDLTMSTSMLYELLEWGAAVLFGGDLGPAFLGNQGDVWDAQKDMALASLGAAIAMGITAAINGVYQRDFAREWADSLRVRGRSPLGEESLWRMLRRTSRRKPKEDYR